MTLGVYGGLWHVLERRYTIVLQVERRAGPSILKPRLSTFSLTAVRISFPIRLGRSLNGIPALRQKRCLGFLLEMEIAAGAIVIALGPTDDAGYTAEGIKRSVRLSLSSISEKMNECPNITLYYLRQTTQGGGSTQLKRGGHDGRLETWPSIS